MDEIWIIQADPEVRVKRIMERDGLTEEEAWERVQSQVSSWRRIANADRVVYNNSDVEKLFQGYTGNMGKQSGVRNALA